MHIQYSKSNKNSVCLYATEQRKPDKLKSRRKKSKKKNAKQTLHMKSKINTILKTLW